jgi:hypothetical protein
VTGAFEPDVDLAVAELETAARKADAEAGVAILHRLVDVLSFDPARAYRDELRAARVAAASSSVMLDAAIEVLKRDRSEPDQLRWIAFVVGSTAARRSRQRSKGHVVLGLVDGEFGDRPLRPHFEALSYLNDPLQGLRVGYALELEALDALKSHPGVVHAVSYFIAELRKCDADEIGEAELRQGVELASKAIQLYEHARFYYTRARLRRELGEFDQARDDLLRAIELEGSVSGDSQKRQVDYAIELSLVDVDRQTVKTRRAFEQELTDARSRLEETEAGVDRRLQQLESRTEDAVRMIEGAELRLIQVAAFVTAAVGLVQFTAGTIGDRPFLSALGLVLGFGVVLLGFVFVLSAVLARRRISGRAT